MTLRGARVVLEPLRNEHADVLHALVGPGDDVWTHMTSEPRTLDDMRAWVAARLAMQNALPFLQRDAQAGAAMGHTSLFDVDLRQGSAEIGHTWLAAPYRGTGANVESKRLLLAHAFEGLGLVRVQLVTDVRNERSQRAMEKLGFTREGVLRHYRRRKDGTPRDSVVYSVIDKEWPKVRSRLDDVLRM